MWTYSITTATSAASSSLRRSYSESEHASESYSQTAANGTVTSTRTADTIYASSLAVGPLETRQTFSGAETVGETVNQTQVIGTASAGIGQTSGTTRNTSQELATEFGQLVTRWTSAETVTMTANDNGTTASLSVASSSTSSSASTYAETRPTYLSGTQTTTATAAGTVTVSASTSASSITGTTGGATTSTTGTTSTMTTGTQASTISTNVYATGAARTLTAAEALVGVTEALAGEMLWEITATVDSAGFISDLGATFTRRTGTLATGSTAMPITSSMGSSDRTYSTTTTAAAATVNTTALAVVTDTHVPFAGIFPATATATRSFTLLTVTTTTLAQTAITSTAVAIESTQTAAATQTIRRTTTAGLPIAWNQAPTVTATELLGVTVATSSTLSDRPRGWPNATSASATLSGATAATGTVTANTTGTISVSTTTNTTTSTGTAATTYTVFISTATAADTCAIPPSTDYSYQLVTHVGYSDAYTFVTTHAAPSNHTRFTSHEQWFAGTVTLTATTNAASSVSTSTASTATFSANSTRAAGSSSTAVHGVSITTASLAPQVSFAGSAAASVIAWRQGGGYQHPLALGTGDALATQQGGAGLLGWSVTASQMNPAGAITPALSTDLRSYTNGATVGTAQYVPSASLFALSTGITYTSTTTQGTATLTRTGTSATGTATASLQTETGATYYSASTHSAGSRIGGQAGNTAFAFTALISPGVVHSTTQSAGASGSATSWATDWQVVTGSSRGVALPQTQESAWSVTQQATGWSLLADSILITTGGATARPLVALSMYPSH